MLPTVFAQEEAPLLKGESYIDGPQITSRANKYDESQDWGMCGAIYLASAELFMQDQPASAKRAKELSNGARIAAWVTLFAPVLSELSNSENPDMDMFVAAWESAKETSASMVDTSLTRLASDMELSSANEASFNQWVANVAATMEVCANSSEGQQLKINMMREIAASGLFTLREND